MSRAGGPPIITSTPTTEVNVGGSFLYSVVARDAEGDPLTYRLLDAPEGATISETTGELSWTPTANQVGQQTIIIEVVDGFGGASAQAFSVLVGDGVVNLPPQIESEAPRFAAVGSDYQYQITANDPEDTSLSYSIGRGPAGLSVDADGLVTWTPAAGQIGQFVVTLIVTDANGTSAIESFELDVLAENNAPVINSFAPAEHFAGEEFQYDVLVNDADFDPLRFELVNGPAGATIDAFGRIRWATNNDLIGTHDFEILVTDPRGGEATQSFTLNVVEDTVAPTLLLADLNNEDGRNILPWQGPIRVFARASDNVGIASLTLTANGEDVPLDANGQAAFEFADIQFNNINVVATAIDVNGNVTTRSIDIDFDFPEGFTGEDGQTLPTAEISSPTPAETVTGFVTITGTADAESFAAYELQIRRADQPESVFETIATGNTAVVNGELGVWDTSLLRNDEYVIRLAVADTDGVVNITEQNVGLSGDLKLGNFQLSFTDLVIPVAGIPVEVTRVYDTLDADIEGELGFGWRLEFRDTDLRVGLPESGLEDIGIHTAFRPGVKVYLNLPGEGRVGFTFDPEIRVLPGLGGENLVLARPRFTADLGVTATLDAGVSGFISVNEFGELMAPGNIPYNPASPDFGGAFVVTTASGISYRISGETGKLESASTPFGREIQFDDLGISSESAGRLVEFFRDPQGRITEVVGPDGERVQYRYNSQGSLAASIDQLGNETTYSYLPDRLSFLDSVDDPIDREPFRVEYDDDGRLTQLVDRNGEISRLSYNIDDQVVTATDAMGRESILVYNERGQVTQSTTTGGENFEFGYDELGRLVSETNPFGETTSYVLDSRGFETEVVSPDGNRERYTYSNNGELLSFVDPLGRLTSYDLDSNGNVVSLTDAAGAVTSFEYNSVGDLIQFVDAAGRTTQYTRDAIGQPTTILYSDSTVTENDFDEAGRLLSTSRTLLIDGVETVTEISFTYDAAGRLVEERNAEGGTNQYTHDAAGRVISSTNALGVPQTFTYSDNDIRTSVEFEDGSTQDYLVDEIGQVTRFTGRGDTISELQYDGADRLASVTIVGESSEVLERQFEIDSLGRLVGISDFAGNFTRWNYEAGERVVEFADGSRQVEKYDAVGNLTETIDKLGRITVFEYDAADRLIQTIFPDGTSTQNTYDDVGQLILQVLADGSTHQFSYDSRGSLSQRISPEGGVHSYEYIYLRDGGPGLPVLYTDPLGETTEYEYDRNGSLIAVTRPGETRVEVTRNALGEVVSLDSSSTQPITYETDGEGRVISKTESDGTIYLATYTPQGNLETLTDSRGTTTHEYDEFDRLIRTSQADGNFVEYEYDNAGRQIAIRTPASETLFTYDSRDRITSTTSDAGSINYTYDAAGQVLQVEYSDGTIEQNGFDENGRLENRSIRRGENILESYVYIRDDAGRVLSVTELDRRTSYTYAANGSLLSETVAPTDGERQTTSYQYDANGNRIRLEGPEGVTTYLYDGVGRLIQSTENGIVSDYSYDDSGNLVSVISTNSQHSYLHNSEGLLTEVRIETETATTIVEYAYDANGRLVARSVDGNETRFLIDDSAGYTRILEEYNPDRSNVVTHHYIGTLVQETNRNGEISRNWYDDHSGLRRTEAGNTVDRINYDAFGNVQSELKEDWTIGFHGEFQDSLTNLTFLRDRFVSNETGRFLTPDDFLPQPGDIQNSNPYIFVNNDPINNQDPSGKFITTAIATAAGFAGLSAAVTAGALALGAARSLLTGYQIYNNFNDGGRDVTGTFETFGVDAVVAGITIADVDTNTRFIRRGVHVKELQASYLYIDVGVGIGASIGRGEANISLFLPSTNEEPDPSLLTGIGGHAGFGAGVATIAIGAGILELGDAAGFFWGGPSFPSEFEEILFVGASVDVGAIGYSSLNGTPSIRGAGRV